MSTHPYVILNRQLRHNARYIEPEVYLNEVLRPRKTGKARGVHLSA